MRGHVYLDTSAYLAILFGEKYASKVLSAISEHILCSSTLLLIEAERNLVRLTRSGALSTDDYARLLSQIKKDEELFLIRDVTKDLCFGDFPAIKTPRSSDLIHLRTARWFDAYEGLDLFCTLDNHQLESAKELQLPAVNPLN